MLALGDAGDFIERLAAQASPRAEWVAWLETLAGRDRAREADIDQQAAVLADRGPGLDPLTAGHGRDHASGPDEGVQPWRGVADAEDIAVGGLAPGVLQPSRQQAAGERARGLAVEGPEFLDTAPHAATIGRAGGGC